MEKRIKAVLEHLATPATQSEHTTSAALPGVVLLHCRAADANKLISIVEVVKRRMREGHFATESTTDSAKPIKKKKGKKAQPSETTWYQYNRIYDVVVAKKDGNTDRAEEEEHDEDFAPMLHRFEEALNGKRGPAIMTYFSTFLSRTPIAELQKNPDMSCQSSVDPLEVEYQKWMANT
ncbi:hypothetical protein SEUCBS140593_006488 [Sporothrix eucalyptigena]|uniref:Uncharacterized protein n=1 Tax=Sporothrix eucalyptigena TaxID=1812306 RepID=A0ABP0C594_9PEZI